MLPNIGRCSHPTGARTSGTWPLIISCLDLPSSFKIFLFMIIFFSFHPSPSLTNDLGYGDKQTRVAMLIDHTQADTVFGPSCRCNHRQVILERIWSRVSIYGWQNQSSLILRYKIFVETTKQIHRYIGIHLGSWPILVVIGRLQWLFCHIPFVAK